MNRLRQRRWRSQLKKRSWPNKIRADRQRESVALKTFFLHRHCIISHFFYFCIWRVECNGVTSKPGQKGVVKGAHRSLIMASPRGSNMSLSNGAKFPSTHSLKSSGGQRSGSQSRLSQTQLAPSKESLHRQATSSGPALSADLLFKMSKKIAQLTKVIYFLNTQHEDRELQEKDMRRMHEEEILRVRDFYGIGGF